MKTGLFILLAMFMSASLGAQTITSEEEYVAHRDSLRNVYRSYIKEWNKEIPPLNKEAFKLEKEAEGNPEHRDSLLALASSHRKIVKEKISSLQAAMDKVNAEISTLEKQYELVFEEAFPHFRKRKLLTKDTLSVILEQASPQIRKSQTGKALKKYISSTQIATGDKFREFACYDNNGKRFNWKSIKGKKVFLIHDGLWCMTHGADNTALRKYLTRIVSQSPECFPLIVVNCTRPEELQEEIQAYGLQDFCVVSEFKGKLGKLNWMYNDQTTPTCHYIDEYGVILNTTEGIEPDYLEKQFLKIK